MRAGIRIVAVQNRLAVIGEDTVDALAVSVPDDHIALDERTAPEAPGAEENPADRTVLQRRSINRAVPDAWEKLVATIVQLAVLEEVTVRRVALSHEHPLAFTRG